MLITEDKDFGELVFRLGKSSAGVILLRSSNTDPEHRLGLILNLVENYEVMRKFITLTGDKIRIRRIS